MSIQGPQGGKKDDSFVSGRVEETRILSLQERGIIVGAKPTSQGDHWSALTLTFAREG